MNTSIRSVRDSTFRTALAFTSLVIAVAAVGTLAHADSFAYPANEITISAPSVTYVNDGTLSGTPMKETRVVARVTTDPAMLNLDSGVALFKASVVEAARKACGADDPRGRVDTACLRGALKEAQPQVDAIIAKARSASNG